MNLMKLFNFNYLKQNFKKSKVILSIFIGLIPILNTIILIMNFSSSKHIFTFSEISIINFIGVYLLPVIVSICLFNYIYKKKSVDFINSMPISRKSVFVTNTISGIIIFFAMLMVNLILMLILTLIFNIPIPIAMMFDYLWYWFIVYVFAFSATNLAMCVSGNAITQIIVTLLLVFLIPFTNLFVKALSNYNYSNNVYLECDSDDCVIEKYYCFDDIECNINKNANIYRTNLDKIENNNYTSLFGFLSYTLMDNNINIINTISVVKMVILSIIYIILGYFLFVRRKMEVSETSFKNIHIHNVVRSLTLVPIVAIFYIGCKDASLITIIFVLLIILIYYFVYDLITKKSINNIKLSIIYFVFTVSILVIFYSIVDLSGNNTKKEIIKYSDIKSSAVDISIYSSNYFDETIDKLYIDNKDLINLIVKNSFDDYSEDKNYHLEVYLKTKNGDKFKETISLTKNDYYKIIDILSENKHYVNYYKNIDLDEVYAVRIGNSIYSKKEADSILKLVKSNLEKLTLRELFDLQKKYNNVNDEFYISLYTYLNHDSREFRVNGYISYELLNLVVNSNNLLLKENMSYIIPEEYYIYYSDSYLTDEFDIDYYVLRNAKKEIYNFILKELDKEVDMHNDYVTLNININSKSYLFTTNNVKEFKEILEKKYEEIKDDPEYLDYYNVKDNEYKVDSNYDN